MEKNRLFEIVADRVAARGRLTFSEYMAICLYEPGLGYYTSPGRKVGVEGDFYTSITVHAAFGRVIAREIAAMWRSMGSPAEFTIVEAGAGHGRLACDIFDFIKQKEPDFYAAASLVLVEKEPSLKAAQQELMSSHQTKLAWLAPEELPTFSFSGVLYSNELLDAMPVHRVLMTSEGLREIFVILEDGQFKESLDTVSDKAIEQYLEKYGMPLMPGQEAEVSLAGLDWFESSVEALKQGFVLTIDYGYPKEELYAAHRKLGTLLCYHKHKAEDNPYQLLGEQDITTHINFSALIDRGRELGLDTVWFGEQCRFLLSAGMVEEFEAIDAQEASETEKLRQRLTLKRLIMPEGGMGDTFKVLVQAKAVSQPRLGCMRSFV